MMMMINKAAQIFLALSRWRLFLHFFLFHFWRVGSVLGNCFFFHFLFNLKRFFHSLPINRKPACRLVGLWFQKCWFEITASPKNVTEDKFKTYVWIMSFWRPSLNVEIGVELWMIFVVVFFNCFCEIHFWAPLRVSKGCMLSLQNLHIDFFDMVINKKVNNYSKFKANFNIRRPVEMTWGTQ